MLFIPVMILLVVVGVLVVIKVVASRYKKIAPGSVGIFYGRKYTYIDPRNPTAGKVTMGFKVVSGGGKIQMPIVEEFQELSTSVFQFAIEELNIPNKANVPINIRGVVTGKISTKPESLMNAAEAFLGKKQPEIQDILKNILLGHVRSIIGNLSIDNLLRERDEFNKKVIEESTSELSRLGVEVTLVIQDVKDDLGYIKALGLKEVAEVKKDADIKVAEANRDRDSAVAEATRDKDIKVSNAQKEASLVAAQNLALVAEANKNKDVLEAGYKVESETALAKAEVAKDIALTDQEMVLRVKQAERDKKEKTAQIEVENEEAKRNEAALNATIVKTAEANKKKLIIEAGANKEKLIIDAGANKEKAVIDAAATTEANIKLAEGNAALITVNAQAVKEQLTLEAAGLLAKKTAEATGTKLTMVAEADGLLAQKTAEATGNELALMAVAKGDAAKVELALKGQAAGTKELAEALKLMDDRGQLIIILEKLPQLIAALGDGGSKVFESIFKSAASPFGSIDSLHIVDMGGNGKGLDKFGGTVPAFVANVFASLKAMGFDPSELLSKLGVDASNLSSLIGKLNFGDTKDVSEKKD